LLFFGAKNFDSANSKEQAALKDRINNHIPLDLQSSGTLLNNAVVQV
jgi:hypothetical protein